MRVLRHARPYRLLPLLIGLVAALLLVSPLRAEAGDPRLESAQQRREAVQHRLDEVLARLDAVEAETAQAHDRVEQLRDRARRHQRQSRSADRHLLERVRTVYKRGQTPPALALLGAEGPVQAAERARVLTLLASRDRLTSEMAVVVRVRASAMADEVDEAVAALEDRQSELAAVRRDVQAALEAARAQEIAVEQTIAREQAAREAAARERAARQRAARQRTAAVSAQPAVAAEPAAPAEPAVAGDDSGGGGSGGGGAGAAPVSGGIACPVGTPRSYSDTYGAPRSGGRSHAGTDILAPGGTPSYAYESGSILRMNSSSLGGISLYLSGDSGNVYYYTHLQGYAAGVSTGKRVAAGELIAYVGDTGNAAGIPHLHFEVAPGGGAGTNPYPYVVRACG